MRIRFNPRVKVSSAQSCFKQINKWSLLAGLVACLCASLLYAEQAMMLVGTGSSVPAPLYARWAVEYNKRSPLIQMRYLPLSTSEGIAEIARGSGDFAAGESPLTAKERTEKKLMELPVALIAIVPIYNLPGTQKEVRFSGEVLAEIFLGHIKSWNSPLITKLNPSVSLPNLPIKVIYRSPGKGSNYIFSEFLSKSSARFRAEVGTTSSPKWPVGMATERSADMAEKVKNEPGSIGFVEYQYAVKQQIPYSFVLNESGQFVKPSGASIGAACSSIESPGWDKFSASLIGAHGADAYPIASFTWLYLQSNTRDTSRASAVVDLLNWTLTDGQTIATQEGYTALPFPLVQKLRMMIKSPR